MDIFVLYTQISQNQIIKGSIMANLKQLKESVKGIASGKDSQYQDDNLAKQNDAKIHNALTTHGITVEKISGVHSHLFNSRRKIYVPVEHQQAANKVLSTFENGQHNKTHSIVSSTTMGGRLTTSAGYGND